MRMISGGKEYNLRIVSICDVELLGEYFEGLSEETKKRFGPHPLTREYAKVICNSGADCCYRFILENSGEKKIIGYFILDFKLSEHEISRYAEFGIELEPFKDVLFAPSLADEYQNMGIASDIMPRLIDFVKSLRGSSLVLMGGTQETNHRAIKFYEKFGFKRHGGYITEEFNHDMRLAL